MPAKYDEIGTGYNSTRQADPYLAERILSLLRPTRDGLYLDLGCGTGNYTVALAQQGLNFVGIDPSEQMLTEAMSRNHQIDWRNGTAEHIPAEDKIFDGIIATLTIHHWRDLKKAFTEISRVLTDKGRLVLFTSTPEQMKGYWLHHYFPRMLHASVAQMPSLEDIQKAIRQTGLKISGTEKYFVRDDLQDFFLYCGKNNPEYYFNETIRHGISSFSSLANADEIRNGLSKLREDIEKGSFDMIKDRYTNEAGDYLFVILEKQISAL